ncbi:MAG: LysR substrate-binding domain-containing protein, partial [Alphaproteobacteria bacterium]
RVDLDVWRLASADGRTAEIRHRPRLACIDFDLLRAAAIAGLGVAMIPQHACIAALRAGTLVPVLADWHGGIDTVHLVFTHRRGLLPAVRALIDHLARELPPAIRRAGIAGMDEDA